MLWNYDLFLNLILNPVVVIVGVLYKIGDLVRQINSSWS